MTNSRNEDKQLKYKIKTNLIDNTLTIEVFKNTFYLKLDNLQLLDKKQVLDIINNVFKSGFIKKEEYAEILNRITYELCLSRVNQKLYNDLYITLCRKCILDNSLFDILFK